MIADFHALVSTISIHTSRAGGDGVRSWEAEKAIRTFQSTPPVREVTFMEGDYKQTIEISIHTSRAGGDLSR